MKERLKELIERGLHRLPDLSNLPLRRQVTGGLAVSVLLHLLAFFLIGLLAAILPQSAAVVPDRAPPLVPVEIEMIPVQIPELAAKPEEPPVIDAEGLQKSKVAPERARFQSSQDMLAASEKAGKGLQPLPSQEGLDLPLTQFRTQQGAVGEVQEAGETAPVKPPMPAYKVKPLPREYLDAMAKVQEIDPEKPGEPVPADPVTKQGPGLEPKPTPSPKPVATPLPKTTEMARLDPQPAKSPGAQPEMRQTRVEGSINNRGRAGVDAIRTPLGEYRRKLSAQIQSRWQYHTRERMDLLALGTVRIRFFVTRDGHAQDIQIVESNSNRSFADVCEQSVREAKLPPPPNDLELMNDGRLELVFSFTLYSDH